MKKLFIVFIGLLAMAGLQAQYYLLSFAGKGVSTKVSSVKVENLTKGTSLVLEGGDQLALTATVGLMEFSSGSINKLIVNPNPMNSSCEILFETKDKANTSFELFDITGKRIFFSREYLDNGQHTYSLSGLGKGVYMLKIQSEKYSFSSKVLCLNETTGQTELTHTDYKSISENIVNDSDYKNYASLKSSQNIVQMLYNTGDNVLFTGVSELSTSITCVAFDPALFPESILFEFMASADGDGNIYPVVYIAGRWWMARNLKTTKFNDELSIQKVVNPEIFPAQTVPAYCWYNNDSVKYSNPYGALYNWRSVNTGKLCPAGWHVPSRDEWTAMVNYIGTESTAGGLLKEKGITHWKEPNTGAVNTTGFSAVPGGWCGNAYKYLGDMGYYWTSSEVSTTGASCFGLDYNWGGCGFEPSNKANGWSVRCVKDVAK